jgi:hypothetical protein
MKAPAPAVEEPVIFSVSGHERTIDHLIVISSTNQYRNLCPTITLLPFHYGCRLYSPRKVILFSDKRHKSIVSYTVDLEPFHWHSLLTQMPFTVLIITSLLLFLHLFLLLLYYVHKQHLMSLRNVLLMWMMFEQHYQHVVNVENVLTTLTTC